MKVLVADDDDSTRMLLRKRLEQRGHEIGEARDGAEVLERLSRGDLPQLVFLDWMMPNLSGVEVCRRIRERSDLGYTHIILLTGKTDHRDIIEGLRCGATDYIVKPIEWDAFYARLEAATHLIELNNLVQSQRLSIMQTAKMATLGEMAAGVAHEINNPLAIIATQVDALRDRTSQSPDYEDLTRSYDLITATVMRISGIVKSLRSFASESGNEPAEEVTLRSVVDQTLSLCHAKLRAHGVELRVDPFSDRAAFYGHRAEISQCLLNLIDNASLAVTALPQRWIRIEATEDDRDLRVAVTDSGDGVPAAIRLKIMQPFFTTRPFGQGKGLGLSVAKGIVESHQGELTLDANSTNTRFVIRLPKATLKKVA